MSTTPNPELLKTRQHFQILDGLRGVAAVTVVIFHFMEIAQPDYEKSFVGHAFLAVDFFFCLSGFVIAYAYDTRIKEIGFSTFVKLRLIRLHPLVIIGSIIGLLCWLFDPFSDLHTKYGAAKAVIMFITSCLMIPYPVIRERYFNLFHYNPPSWSLFWEYIANIFYALVLVKLRNKILWVLVVIAAGLIIFEASRSGNLSGGWGGDNIPAGFIRVFYSFLAGMLVYRLGWILKTRLGFLSVSILLLAVLTSQYSNKWNFISEPLIVIFVLPFLVSLGAGATLRPVFNHICKFSGELSYPLYMVHYPFIWIFFSYIEKCKPAVNELLIVIPVSVVLLVVFAWLIMTFIDVPIRKYLKRRMERSL
ncbi:acyltransferase [Mucilaginibacter corticis]|uniref:Acyltransferase n=1 Tax=Mucilaginibacter corticis TaxID=2597670 RepID=A0A556MW16_9SPHI|nr:acyltransferase [Mucilaginibacter corticis]TSJ44062.1 acyltransferase [Mucilaginibacter corticis]